jgi:hypothetical protein
MLEQMIPLEFATFAYSSPNNFFEIILGLFWLSVFWSAERREDGG